MDYFLLRRHKKKSRVGGFKLQSVWEPQTQHFVFALATLQNPRQRPLLLHYAKPRLLRKLLRLTILRSNSISAFLAAFVFKHVLLEQTNKTNLTFSLMSARSLKEEGRVQEASIGVCTYPWDL